MGFGTKVDRDIESFQRRMRMQLRQNLKKALANEPIITERKAKITLPREVGALPTAAKPPNYPLRRWLSRGDPITSRPGDEIGRLPTQGAGGTSAGNDIGEHGLEVWVNEADLYALIAEEWALPQWEPKEGGMEETTTWNWNRRGTVGPPSRWLRRKTMQEVVRRGGWLDPGALRYRKASQEVEPQTSAVVALIRDISGSMVSEEMTAWIRLMAFVLLLWLRQRYPTVQVEFFTYDYAANRIFIESEWFGATPSGGTRLRTALDLVTETFTEHYPRSQWQWYQFLWTDGQDFDADAIGEWLNQGADQWNELGWVATEIPHPQEVDPARDRPSLLQSGIFLEASRFLEQSPEAHLRLTEVLGDEDIRMALSHLLSETVERGDR